MLQVLFPVLGGLGLFLIGMMLLAQGLVAFGGDVLKRAMVRFTGAPAKAVLSGALATVVVQSSSATTVTLIGFVSAGLITFGQSIGVLMGASLGNTATGWIVAGLGLKVNLGFYTLPLIGLGALFKLMGKGRKAELGLALAGFGMMFAGLNTLQEGMRGLSGAVDLASLPTGGLGARVLIVLFGLALTAVLQSSTAAIATTLTALHAQALNFDQAAALVVGAAIGTTMTGVLATIGGTVHARRAALAYILFNAVVGALAIVLLPLLFALIEGLRRHAGLDAGAMSLAAFHTLFMALGVLLFLPLLSRFAALVERLVPEKDTDITQRLDDSLLTIPSVALEASQRALERSTEGLLDVCGDLLAGPAGKVTPAALQALGHALESAYTFVSRIEVLPGDKPTSAQRIAQLHALDHLMRFRTRLEDLQRVQPDLTARSYEWALSHNRRLLDLARQGLADRQLQSLLPEMQQQAMGLTELSRQMRHELLDHESRMDSDIAGILARADVYRWLERSGHHVWRICHYLAQGRLQQKPGEG